MADVLGIRDIIGSKEANVYWLTRREGMEDQWEQVLPTPEIVDLLHTSNPLEGGVVQVGQIMLKNIPLQGFSESDLDTSSEDETLRKYWVIAGPGLETKAYTTARIHKKSIVAFDVFLKRYDSLNSSDLIVPEASNG